jgi:hypothetical protein
MGEVTHLTTDLEGCPRFLSLLCISLLYRLAGQESFTVADLSAYNRDFDGLRIVHESNTDKVEEGTVTVTLHRRAA